MYFSHPGEQQNSYQQHQYQHVGGAQQSTYYAQQQQQGSASLHLHRGQGGPSPPPYQNNHYHHQPQPQQQYQQQWTSPAAGVGHPTHQQGGPSSMQLPPSYGIGAPLTHATNELYQQQQQQQSYQSNYYNVYSQQTGGGGGLGGREVPLPPFYPPTTSFPTQMSNDTLQFLNNDNSATAEAARARESYNYSSAHYNNATTVGLGAGAASQSFVSHFSSQIPAAAAAAAHGYNPNNNINTATALTPAMPFAGGEVSSYAVANKTLPTLTTNTSNANTHHTAAAVTAAFPPFYYHQSFGEGSVGSSMPADTTMSNINASSLIYGNGVGGVGVGVGVGGAGGAFFGGGMGGHSSSFMMHGAGAMSSSSLHLAGSLSRGTCSRTAVTTSSTTAGASTATTITAGASGGEAVAAATVTTPTPTPTLATQTIGSGDGGSGVSASTSGSPLQQPPFSADNNTSSNAATAAAAVTAMPPSSKSNSTQHHEELPSPPFTTNKACNKDEESSAPHHTGHLHHQYQHQHQHLHEYQDYSLTMTDVPPLLTTSSTAFGRGVVASNTLLYEEEQKKHVEKAEATPNTNTYHRGTHSGRTIRGGENTTIHIAVQEEDDKQKGRGEGGKDANYNNQNIYNPLEERTPLSDEEPTTMSNTTAGMLRTSTAQPSPSSPACTVSPLLPRATVLLPPPSSLLVPSAADGTASLLPYFAKDSRTNTTNTTTTTTTTTANNTLWGTHSRDEGDRGGATVAGTKQRERDESGLRSSTMAAAYSSFSHSNSQQLQSLVGGGYSVAVNDGSTVSLLLAGARQPAAAFIDPSSVSNDRNKKEDDALRPSHVLHMRSTTAAAAETIFMHPDRRTVGEEERLTPAKTPRSIKAADTSRPTTTEATHYRGGGGEGQPHYRKEGGHHEAEEDSLIDLHKFPPVTTFLFGGGLAIGSDGAGAAVGGNPLLDGANSGFIGGGNSYNTLLTFVRATPSKSAVVTRDRRVGGADDGNAESDDDNLLDTRDTITRSNGAAAGIEGEAEDEGAALIRFGGGGFGRRDRATSLATASLFLTAASGGDPAPSAGVYEIKKRSSLPAAACTTVEDGCPLTASGRRTSLNDDDSEGQREKQRKGSIRQFGGAPTTRARLSFTEEEDNTDPLQNNKSAFSILRNREDGNLINIAAATGGSGRPAGVPDRSISPSLSHDNNATTRRYLPLSANTKKTAADSDRRRSSAFGAEDSWLCHMQDAVEETGLKWLSSAVNDENSTTAYVPSSSHPHHQLGGSIYGGLAGGGHSLVSFPIASSVCVQTGIGGGGGTTQASASALIQTLTMSAQQQLSLLSASGGGAASSGRLVTLSPQLRAAAACSSTKELNPAAAHVSGTMSTKGLTTISEVATSSVAPRPQPAIVINNSSSGNDTRATTTHNNNTTTVKVTANNRNVNNDSSSAVMFSDKTPVYFLSGEASHGSVEMVSTLATIGGGTTYDLHTSATMASNPVATTATTTTAAANNANAKSVVGTTAEVNGYSYVHTNYNSGLLFVAEDDRNSKTHAPSSTTTHTTTTTTQSTRQDRTEEMDSNTTTSNTHSRKLRSGSLPSLYSTVAINNAAVFAADDGTGVQQNFHHVTTETDKREFWLSSEPQPHHDHQHQYQEEEERLRGGDVYTRPPRTSSADARGLSPLQQRGGEGEPDQNWGYKERTTKQRQDHDDPLMFDAHTSDAAAQLAKLLAMGGAANTIKYSNNSNKQGVHGGHDDIRVAPPAHPPAVATTEELMLNNSRTSSGGLPALPPPTFFGTENMRLLLLSHDDERRNTSSSVLSTAVTTATTGAGNHTNTYTCNTSTGNHNANIAADHATDNKGTSSAATTTANNNNRSITTATTAADLGAVGSERLRFSAGSIFGVGNSVAGTFGAALGGGGGRAGSLGGGINGTSSMSALGMMVLGGGGGGVSPSGLKGAAGGSGVGAEAASSSRMSRPLTPIQLDDTHHYDNDTINNASSTSFGGAFPPPRLVTQPRRSDHSQKETTNTADHQHSPRTLSPNPNPNHPTLQPSTASAPLSASDVSRGAGEGAKAATHGYTTHAEPYGSYAAIPSYPYTQSTATHDAFHPAPPRPQQIADGGGGGGGVISPTPASGMPHQLNPPQLALGNGVANQYQQQYHQQQQQGLLMQNTLMGPTAAAASAGNGINDNNNTLAGNIPYYQQQQHPQHRQHHVMASFPSFPLPQQQAVGGHLYSGAQFQYQNHHLPQQPPVDGGGGGGATAAVALQVPPQLPQYVHTSNPPLPQPSAYSLGSATGLGNHTITNDTNFNYYRDSNTSQHEHDARGRVPLPPADAAAAMLMNHQSQIPYQQQPNPQPQSQYPQHHLYQNQNHHQPQQQQQQHAGVSLPPPPTALGSYAVPSHLDPRQHQNQQQQYGLVTAASVGPNQFNQQQQQQQQQYSSAAPLHQPPFVHPMQAIPMSQSLDPVAAAYGHQQQQQPVGLALGGFLQHPQQTSLTSSIVPYQQQQQHHQMVQQQQQRLAVPEILSITATAQHPPLAMNGGAPFRIGGGDMFANFYMQHPHLFQQQQQHQYVVGPHAALPPPPPPPHYHGLPLFGMGPVINIKHTKENNKSKDKKKMVKALNATAEVSGSDPASTAKVIAKNDKNKEVKGLNGEKDENGDGKQQQGRGEENADDAGFTAVVGGEGKRKKRRKKKKAKDDPEGDDEDGGVDEVGGGGGEEDEGDDKADRKHAANNRKKAAANNDGSTSYSNPADTTADSTTAFATKGRLIIESQTLPFLCRGYLWPPALNRRTLRGVLYGRVNPSEISCAPSTLTTAAAVAAAASSSQTQMAICTNAAGAEGSSNVAAELSHNADVIRTNTNNDAVVSVTHNNDTNNKDETNINADNVASENQPNKTEDQPQPQPQQSRSRSSGGVRRVPLPLWLAYQHRTTTEAASTSASSPDALASQQGTTAAEGAGERDGEDTLVEERKEEGAPPPTDDKRHGEEDYAKSAQKDNEKEAEAGRGAQEEEEATTGNAEAVSSSVKLKHQRNEVSFDNTAVTDEEWLLQHSFIGQLETKYCPEENIIIIVPVEKEGGGDPIPPEAAVIPPIKLAYRMLTHHEYEQLHLAIDAFVDEDAAPQQLTHTQQ